MKDTINNFQENEQKELYKLLIAEHKQQEKDWIEAKKELKNLIHPKYFSFAESHESYSNCGIVNIIEVKERKQGYSTYPHCREFGTKDNRLYIKHITELETFDEESKYEGEEIEYWVWQTVGHCEDDFSGFLLLPMKDGRYWKIGYSC